jgi:hypothetical protein
MLRFVMPLAIVATLAFSGCDQSFVDAIGSDNHVDANVVMDGPEALAWLKSNQNESALASNRFLGTENAVRFVKALYAAGATKVVVPRDTIRDDEETVLGEGGPYADALVVTTPADPDRRQAIVDLCRKELRREGFDSPEAATAEHIYLWWD